MQRKGKERKGKERLNRASCVYSSLYVSYFIDCRDSNAEEFLSRSCTTTTTTPLNPVFVEAAAAAAALARQEVECIRISKKTLGGEGTRGLI